MAALTRSGARNASEIVMLTLRILQHFRWAIASTVMAGSLMSSFSHRRPLAIEAISSVRGSLTGSYAPRLEAENAALRSADCAAAEGERSHPPDQRRSPSLYPAISMVSVGAEGHHRHPSRDARALASGRLSLLLALEIALAGRAPADSELRVLIRHISIENPLWGAPRIHGELLKLGFEAAQSSVAKYMVERRLPPSQGWSSCAITRRTSPPWICSSSRPLASICSMPSSSFD